MSDTARILVVANRTAESVELLAHLRERLAAGPIEVTLLVPATWEVSDPHGGRETANRRMCRALDEIRGLGVTVQGRVGDADPFTAFTDAWKAERFDEVVVCTLPNRLSQWLKRDLPRRVEQVAGFPITHVVATERVSVPA